MFENIIQSILQLVVIWGPLFYTKLLNYKGQI